MIVQIQINGDLKDIGIAVDCSSDKEREAALEDLIFYLKEMHVYYEEYKKQYQKYVNAWKSDDSADDVLRDLKNIYSTYACSVCKFFAQIENIILEEKERKQ